MKYWLSYSLLQCTDSDCWFWLNCYFTSEIVCHFQVVPNKWVLSAWIGMAAQPFKWLHAIIQLPCINEVIKLSGKGDIKGGYFTCHHSIWREFWYLKDTHPIQWQQHNWNSRLAFTKSHSSTVDYDTMINNGPDCGCSSATWSRSPLFSLCQHLYATIDNGPYLFYSKCEWAWLQMQREMLMQNNSWLLWSTNEIAPHRRGLLVNEPLSTMGYISVQFECFSRFTSYEFDGRNVIRQSWELPTRNSQCGD